MYYFTKDKPYNTLTEYNKVKYNAKVAKISLNASLSCPNKDGTKGFGGCSFSSPLGSGDFAGDKNKSITEQFLDIKKIMEKKWPNILYMPYFQANSNTYAKKEVLKKLYLEAINVDRNKTVGISIATRADCINEEVIEVLKEIQTLTHVQVELGLQTSNEATAIKINRGLSNQEFIDAVAMLRKINVEVVVHIINGLPNETKEDMLNTIHFINSLDIQGIKLHSLLVLKNTKIYNEYKNNEFKILTLDEYVDIVASQITILKPSIIIHRLAADGVLEDLVEPKWSSKKLVVMNNIDKYLRNNNLYQGIYYNK